MLRDTGDLVGGTVVDDTGVNGNDVDPISGEWLGERV